MCVAMSGERRVHFYGVIGGLATPLSEIYSEELPKQLLPGTSRE